MATGMDSAGHMTGVVAWLLDSDPAIRWQVMRDLTHEPAEVVDARVRAGPAGQAHPELTERRQLVPDAGQTSKRQRVAPNGSAVATPNAVLGVNS
jgi:hypothetical protein